MLLIRFAIRRPFPSSLEVLHPHTLNYCSISASSSAAAAEADRCIREGPRNDWTRPQIKSIYDSLLLDLIFHGAQVHRHADNFRELQQCTLLSIKTGGCSEDCSYCPQSSRYSTGVKAEKLMGKDSVLDAAQKNGKVSSIRDLICQKCEVLTFEMGRVNVLYYDRDQLLEWCKRGRWHSFLYGCCLEGYHRKTNFNQILDYVKQIRSMGMEVCCTLGMLEKQQALELKEAYNHNLDTSREYYPNIITTRTYDDRLETLKNVREAGMSVCSGGIIGLGEAVDDRIGLLHTLATLPESKTYF